MKFVTTFIVLLTVYLLLAGFMVDELIVGILVSLIVTIIIAKYVNYQIDYKLPYRLLVFVFVYLPLFIWKLVLANIDVARRVLSPKIPLNPGFVKIPTDLKGDFAKLTLANSITLTPGTLSIDVENEHIYVHTVDVKGKDEAENKKNISSACEKVLEVIFK